MTDIKSRLIEGMRGQGIRLPDGDWLRLDDNNLTLIADRLLSLPGIAIVDTEADIDRVAKALCNGYFDAEDGWDRCVVKHGRELWRRSARAAIAAAAVQAQEPK